MEHNNYTTDISNLQSLLELYLNMEYSEATPRDQQ